ncbi:hypothetical protein [Halolamina sp. C58]|uniref:hypothetical protein n=1 Tax=Halolamina sp. C58 TaxID=3421640 RepID=UPI003EBDCC3C
MLTEFVLPVTSSITAAGVVYIAREAHHVRKTVERNRQRSEQNEERSRENKERSLLNRAALAREGLTKRDRRNREESHG